MFDLECLAIESEQRLKGEDVFLVLSRMKIQRGVPIIKILYCDNGSEFSSQAMDLWAFMDSARRRRYKVLCESPRTPGLVAAIRPTHCLDSGPTG